MKYAANDQIQIALIGSGGMGQGDVRDALLNEGVRVIAAADVYDGRLRKMQETYPGIFTTRDYREVLARKDVDAVIIATPDHWHARISIDALEAGKDVYCEKPMVQKIEEGKQVIDAHRRSGRIFQVGSQYASALSFQKIGQLIRQGAIGELNMVEAWLDRNTALGAWQYSIPPDASPANIDWDRFLGHAPKRPFEPIRLFRWRNYLDYGTAVAGDLYVHLLTGLHTALGALGPTRIFSTGGIRYWRDGRETPDTLAAWLDYPEGFGVELAVSLNGVRPRRELAIVGTLGALTIGEHDVTFHAEPLAEPYEAVAETWPARYREWFYMIHGMTPQGLVRGRVAAERAAERYEPPAAVAPEAAHLADFVESIRAGRAPREPLAAGLAAADAGLLVAEAAEAGAVVR